MDKPSFKLVGAPCGHHGQYTFYKALRIIGEKEKIIAIGDFFFVRIWQDSELVSIGELQLLWTDRVSDQTLVSLRLYFLPENTPEGRNQQGEDEVLAINDKVVVRADDLMSWMCGGGAWRWGLRAVWRGACAPPAEPKPTKPLHLTRLDFSDVDTEKSAIEVDTDAPGVVVFSYPRYCRYRALLARLEGIQADWLRDSLVAALGGYAAPTNNTRILYCKDTFEYPELEGHEFVCNHLAPRLKGRPRGRRRRNRNLSPSPSPSPSDTSDAPHSPPPQTPRRLSLRNGAADKHSSESGEECRRPDPTAEDRAFLHHLNMFYRHRNDTFKAGHTLKDLSLRALYHAVTSRGGYEAVCRHKLWRALAVDQPARTRRHYERFLLPYENHERRNGTTFKLNGKIDCEPHTIATIDVTDSPLRDGDRTPDRIHSPPPPRTHEKAEIDNETGELKEDLVQKNAEELNREFLESLPKEEKCMKISVKPVEKLIDTSAVKLFEEKGYGGELIMKHSATDLVKKVEEGKDLSRGSNMFLNELAHKLNLGKGDTSFLQELALAGCQPPLAPANGHMLPVAELKSHRPAGKSSLRAVRVKPTRQQAAPSSTPPNPLRPDSASSSPPSSTSLSSTPLPSTPLSSTPLSIALSAPPILSTTTAPVTNFGIHHPPVMTSTPHSDDEIVEVPYKPKTPEIIDLDEYPESPQAAKRKKLDLLKERGLEVTPLPVPAWRGITPPVITPPVIAPPVITPPVALDPAVQHQIATQARLFQMYNIIPPNYSNGIQPPKVIQGASAFGSAGPEKTVYGNPKDPFMCAPHLLAGAPLQPRSAPPALPAPRPHVLDLTCKQQPRPAPSPQNLSRNYLVRDGKAVVGSNLEITLVSKSPPRNRPPQKRSSNGKFVSARPASASEPAPSPQRRPAITVPSYHVGGDLAPPPDSGYKNPGLSRAMDLQKGGMPMTSFMDPYMALYNVAGSVDQRQLAMYRDLMANQFRGYPGLLNLGVASTPTTKN